jgi:hypothetical protein
LLNLLRRREAFGLAGGGPDAPSAVARASATIEEICDMAVSVALRNDWLVRTLDMTCVFCSSKPCSPMTCNEATGDSLGN